MDSDDSPDFIEGQHKNKKQKTEDIVVTVENWL